MQTEEEASCTEAQARTSERLQVALLTALIFNKQRVSGEALQWLLVDTSHALDVGLLMRLGEGTRSHDVLSPIFVSWFLKNRFKCGEDCCSDAYYLYTELCILERLPRRLQLLIAASALIWSKYGFTSSIENAKFQLGEHSAGVSQEVSTSEDEQSRI